MHLFAWAGFLLFVVAVMAFDLGVFHRRARLISAGEAIRFTIGLMIVSTLFAIPIYYLYEYQIWGFGTIERAHHVERIDGVTAVWEYLIAYVLEMSLSTDNVFVIAVIFRYFKVPIENQHRVLFWGIIGALILRGVIISLGFTLLNYVDWMMYVFGALLIWGGIKLLFINDESNPHPERNLLVRFARLFYPVSPYFAGDHFFTRTAIANSAGIETIRWAMTPMFLALLVVETTDVIFAIDSIPAVLGVTQSSFIAFTSNIFAILGLRSLFFAVNSLIDRFHYMKYCLGVLLAYIGAKMLLTTYFDLHLGPMTALGPIVLILSAGAFLSWFAGAPKSKVELPKP